MRTQEEATAAAKELAGGLGPAWEPDVWQNMGWHYRAVACGGRVKVHPSTNGYTCFTSYVPGSGGDIGWTGGGVTPLEAVRASITAVATTHLRAQEMLNLMNEAVGA